MRSEETVLKANDGVELFVRRFQPPGGDAERTVLLIHGMAEHGQRYLHVAESMVARGWNVLVPDLRGHGLSAGEDIHVDDFSEYVADLKRVFDESGLSAQKTALVGHSMGGLISARFAQQYPECVSALALLSPLLGVRVAVSPLTVAFGRILSIVRPRSRFRKRIVPEHTTRNPDVLARNASDPLIRQTLTASWYFAMRKALKLVWDLSGRIACPVLVLQAGDDLIVDPNAPHRWLDRVASADKTLRVFPEHYHELLNETDWADTLAGMLDWLEERVVGRNAAPAQWITAAWPLSETA